MNPGERLPSISIYRPVLNISPEMIGDVRTLAADFQLKPNNVDEQWCVQIVAPGEVRAFYTQHEVDVDMDHIEQLTEYCEDMAPSSSDAEVSISTWPPNVYDHRRSKGHRFVVRELGTVGKLHPTTAEERRQYKQHIEDFGDAHGPLRGGWIPVSYACEVYVIKAQRTAQQSSSLRKFMRGLRGANILPNTLQIGPVEVKVDEAE